MADPEDSCIFCKIVAGDIPSAKVFEDEHCLSFLDIGPLAPGHLLVIPKRHVERLWDLDRDDAAAIAEVLPKLAKVVVETTGAEGCNILQNNGEVSGQVVPHLHVHVIPRRSGDGLGYRWNAGSYGEGELDSMQAKMLETRNAIFG
jgi:histidine triad (HIT) family protein